MTGFHFDLVVFDLDGTLIDAFQDITSAANHIRRLNDLPELTVADVKKHVGHGARQLVAGVLPEATEQEVDQNLAALVTYYEGLKESTATVYDQVLDTLAALCGQGIKTAIASNKPHTITVQVAETLGLTPLLDYVRGEGAGIARKPAPDVLQFLMEQAGATPNRTLMVGDTDVDIACARAAGIRVAAVTYGQYDEAFLRNHAPDWMIGSMGQLLGIVGRGQ